MYLAMFSMDICMYIHVYACVNDVKCLYTNARH